MKIIVIETCKGCPYVELAHCGKKLVCKHPKLIVERPYAVNREIKSYPPGFFPSFCNLDNKK